MAQWLRFPLQGMWVQSLVGELARTNCHMLCRAAKSEDPQITNAGDGVEKRESSYTVGTNGNRCRLYGEQYVDSLRNLKIKVPHDSETPFLGIYPEKTSNSKRHMHLNVHCSIIYNSQDMEATQMTINDEWIKNVVHILYIYIYIHVQWSITQPQERRK